MNECDDALYVLSLIAAPRKTCLTDADARAALNAAGLRARHTCWLANGQAWEAHFDAQPDAAGISRLFDRRAIDVNVIAGEHRRKKLLIADMDATMIVQECIDELAEVAGVGGEVRKITARAMAGDLNFEDAMRERVARIAGLPETAIGDVIARRLTFTAGGRDLVQTMNAAGAFTALVSGGFSRFTAHVAARLGFQYHQANELVIEHGAITGLIVEPVLGQNAKVCTLKRLTAQLAISAGDVIAVGDGANDIPMLAAAGLGVAFQAKPVVRAAARVTINHGDLTALLYLQGYHRREFASTES